MATAQRRLNVVLDIDETLVYFIHNRFKAHSWDTLSAEEKAKYEVIETPSGLFIKRPHLDEFFDYLFANCTVSLWTWSDKEYARGIVDKFIKAGHPERRLAHVLSEDHATAASENYGYSKDLNYLYWEDLRNNESEPITNFKPCNTVLIDDLPGNSVNSANVHNSITIKPFALFGEVKARTDPYEDVSRDDSLFVTMDILRRAAAHPCDDEDVPIFDLSHLGDLEEFVKAIKTKKGDIVKAIAVGESMHIVGGRRRRHRGVTRRRGRKQQTRRRL